MSNIGNELGTVITIASFSDDVGKRVDAFIAERSGLTRSAAARAIEDGDVRLVGREGTIPKNYKLRGGDVFELELPAPEDSEAKPEDIPLDVVYEDDDVIVVNKPKGMVVHPAPGNTSGTLVNALLHHCRGSLSGIGGVVRPGIVHRIDKDTGGLLIVAKNDRAHLSLAEQIKVHDVSRVYYAIALGNFKEDEGTVDAPIGRHPVDRKRMAVIRSSDKRSREAVTHWRVVERFGRFTLLRCELETGRTHQIRVHMASIGHSLLGDNVYGGAGTQFQTKHKRLIDGQCLFAAELSFTHPSTGERMTVSAELPDYFEKLLCELRKESI